MQKLFDLAQGLRVNERFWSRQLDCLITRKRLGLLIESPYKRFFIFKDSRKTVELS